MSNLVKTLGKYEYDNLINDISIPVVEKGVKLAKGTKLKRGAVLGIVKESGIAVLVDSTKEDGSQIADCILANDVEASEDIVEAAYISGQFNRKALNFGEDSADVHELRLRELGIFLKDNM